MPSSPLENLSRISGVKNSPLLNCSSSACLASRAFSDSILVFSASCAPLVAGPKIPALCSRFTASLISGAGAVGNGCGSAAPGSAGMGNRRPSSRSLLIRSLPSSVVGSAISRFNIAAFFEVLKASIFGLFFCAALTASS